MNFLILFIICLLTVTVSIFVGIVIANSNVHIVTDTFIVNKNRTENLQRQDAVMLLKNELAKCKGLKLKYNEESGETTVTLRIKCK